MGGSFHSMRLISLKPVFWPWKAGFCLLRVERGRRGGGRRPSPFLKKKTFLCLEKKLFYFDSVCKQNYFHFQLLLQSPLSMQKGKLRIFRGFTMSWKSQKSVAVRKDKVLRREYQRGGEGGGGGYLKALIVQNNVPWTMAMKKGQLVIDAFHGCPQPTLSMQLWRQNWLIGYLWRKCGCHNIFWQIYWVSQA